MNIGELLMISLALAVDAATYAFSYGLALGGRSHARASLLLALSVGLFQAGMPLLGYVGGLGLREVLESWGQWVVFMIFVSLGASVIWKAWKGDEEAVAIQPLGALGLLLVGLATSMDAFAIGICMAVGSVLGESLSVPQLLCAVSVIGFVTFFCALAFFHLSRIFRHLPERGLQTMAGLILIALGVRAML